MTLLRNKKIAAPHNLIVSARDYRLHLLWERAAFETIAPAPRAKEEPMAKNDGEIVIKKYANRRLYNTGTSTYVTLEDLAKMVKKGEEFTVQDAKSGEDITHAVLTQIIFEQESKTGNTLLPVSFLRQLISYYGDQMQMVVPTFLEHSMKTFTDQQVQMREQMTRAFGDTPLGKNLQVPMQMMEDQVRRNTELFRQAMQMFAPFTPPTPAAPAARPSDAKDLDELKEQLRALQTRLDSMGA
jgi:polyhydroxyalkanoate synthesis repressor PhaR